MASSILSLDQRRSKEREKTSSENKRKLSSRKKGMNIFSVVMYINTWRLQANSKNSQFNKRFESNQKNVFLTSSLAPPSPLLLVFKAFFHFLHVDFSISQILCWFINVVVCLAAIQVKSFSSDVCREGN